MARLRFISFLLFGTFRQWVDVFAVITTSWALQPRLSAPMANSLAVLLSMMSPMLLHVNWALNPLVRRRTRNTRLGFTMLLGKLGKPLILAAAASRLLTREFATRSGERPVWVAQTVVAQLV